MANTLQGNRTAQTIPQDWYKWLVVRFLQVAITATLVTVGDVSPSFAAEDHPLQKPGDDFLDGWKSIDGPARNTPPRVEWGESRNGLKVCKLAIERLLSSEQLGKNAEMTVKFLPDVIPNYKIVRKRCSSTDQFKFEQAIWEVAPFTGLLARPNGVIDLKQQSGARPNENEKKFFEQHPDLRDKGVLIHVISRNIVDYVRFKDTFTPESLEQAQNLRLIPMSKVGSPELRKFRRDWIAFTLKWPRSTSRQQILDFAASLLNKYPSLFEG